MLTAEAIVTHMRKLGPNARVLLMSPNIYLAKELISGEKGLMTLYPKEFSAKTPNLQVTHALAGVIHVCPLEDEDPRWGDRLRGHRYSMVVFENLPTDSTEGGRSDAIDKLVLPPREWVESENGEYEETGNIQETFTKSKV